jgi:ABC-type lipoprotein export system ATPase subunit
MTVITLDNVYKTYTLHKTNSVAAVRGVSLEIQKGEFLIITGRSGSGKTTLLNLAAGLTCPTKGGVVWDGADLWKLSDGQQSLLRNQKIGFVFQFPSLVPTLTVYENVILPAAFSGKKRGPDQPKRAEKLLESVGLADKQNVFPRQLSAGQQQRVVIARALINQPEIIIADEPTSDLDEQTEQEIMQLFSGFHKHAGVTIVMVTHAVSLVSYGTRSLAMTAGAIAV